jgi:hypothetical protein
MKKEEIYVEITNEIERLRAIEILQNAGEEIWEDSKLLMPFETKINAVFDENTEVGSNWILFDKVVHKTKITLDELEALLNPKKSNVSMGLLECLKQVQQHLINDYPQGTEIKISKDKIEIYHS